MLKIDSLSAHTNNDQIEWQQKQKKKCNEIKQKGWRVNWYRMIGSTQSGLWNCHCCWQELICAALNPWACQTANLQIESKFIIAASTVNNRERQRRIKKRVRSQHTIYTNILLTSIYTFFACHGTFFSHNSSTFAAALCVIIAHEVEVDSAKWCVDNVHRHRRTHLYARINSIASAVARRQQTQSKVKWWMAEKYCDYNNMQLFMNFHFFFHRYVNKNK